MSRSKIQSSPEPSRPAPEAAETRAAAGGEATRSQDGADRTDPAPQRPSRGAVTGNLETGLYVVATPIGNLRDITLRALDVLSGVEMVFAEDTRVARKLLAAHGLRARLEAYHEHNAEPAGARALAALARGAAVALTTDAGTPLVSDPGFRLVRAAAAAGHRIIPVPGPSAPIAALSAAGLPSDRFLFAGFLPPRDKARRAALQELAGVKATLIFFETGPRLAESVAAMAQVLGPREAVLAREITKVFEEFRRADLAELAASLAAAAALGEPPKGEMVVLVGPGAERAGASDAALDEALRTAMAGMKLKDAANAVAEAFSVSRRDVYARALALKAAPDHD